MSQDSVWSLKFFSTGDGGRWIFIRRGRDHDGNASFVHGAVIFQATGNVGRNGDFLANRQPLHQISDQMDQRRSIRFIFTQLERITD
jgi:hypothetical protein